MTQPHVETFTLEELSLAAEGPYILLRLKPDSDPGSIGYKISLTAGGGIQRVETMLALMIQAVTETTGADQDLLLQEIDTLWRAAGKGSFVDQAFSELGDDE